MAQRKQHKGPIVMLQVKNQSYQDNHWTKGNNRRTRGRHNSEMQNNLAQKGGEEVGLNRQKKSWGWRKEVHRKKTNTKTQGHKSLNPGCFHKEDLHTPTPHVTVLCDAVFLVMFLHHRSELPQSVHTRQTGLITVIVTDKQYMHNQVSLRLT